MIWFWMPLIICLLKLVHSSRNLEYSREYWQTNFRTALPFDIYNIWSDPNVENPYFYGNYNGLTVIGNSSMLQTFEITPTDRSDCKNNKLYFIGINIYERLCLYWEDEGFGLVWSNKNNGRFKFDFYFVPHEIEVVHFSFQTVSNSYLCKVTSKDREDSWLSINDEIKIESIVSYGINSYLVAATHFYNESLQYYLVNQLK